MSKLEKYIHLAKQLKMVNVKLISPREVFFDIRAILKCRWGCQDFFKNSIKCHARNISYQEHIEMIKAYQHILLIHSHNARELSIAVLEIERTAFLDGYYFAFAIRYCSLCESCAIEKGDSCPTPDKVRPCDQSFGIDVYRTARNLGLPCDVLQTKDNIQNRYGFVLLD